MYSYTKTYSAPCEATITITDNGLSSIHGYNIEIDHGEVTFAAIRREDVGFFDQSFISFFILPSALPLPRCILRDLERNEKERKETKRK